MERIDHKIRIKTVGDTVRGLDIIASFCVRTIMIINLQKAKVMVFQNGRILSYYEKRYFNGDVNSLYLLTNIWVYLLLRN